MQTQNGTKADATLNTQNNVNETHNKDYLAHNKELSSGLVIRYREDKGWFTTLGDTIVTEPTQTEEEQIEQLENEYYKITQKIAIHIYKTMRALDIINKNTDRMTQTGL